MKHGEKTWLGEEKLFRDSSYDYSISIGNLMRKTDLMVFVNLLQVDKKQIFMV